MSELFGKSCNELKTEMKDSDRAVMMMMSITMTILILANEVRR